MSQTQEKQHFYQVVYAGAEKGKRRGEMDVTVKKVEEEDKAAFEQLFRQMYVYYKTGQLLENHIAKAAAELGMPEQDIRNIWKEKNTHARAKDVEKVYSRYLEPEFQKAFAETWAHIKKGESIATIAYAKGDQALEALTDKHAHLVIDGVPVSFTYGMKSIDPRTGHPDMQVEVILDPTGIPQAASGAKSHRRVEQSSTSGLEYHRHALLDVRSQSLYPRGVRETAQSRREAPGRRDTFPHHAQG